MARAVVAVFLASFLLVLASDAIARKSRPQSALPLVGEEAGAHRRKGKKTSECHFGKKTYELEEAWHPDLGSPFGVMYCVNCECTQVHRKKRIVGKVRCKNVKNECPEQLQCEEPVLLAGQCCKTCPLNTYDGMQLEEEMARKYDSEEAGNEYAALLTPDIVNPPGPSGSLASGRFIFHKRNLHYSLLYVGPEAPSMLQFTDEKGYVVEEHEVQATRENSATYKLCGVWRKLPKIYRKMLRQDGMNGMVVRIVTSSYPDGAVGGALTKFYAVKTEIFSALLTVTSDNPVPSSRAGGLVIISTASVQQAAHFLVMFRGLPNQEKDGKETFTVGVRLEAREDNEDLTTIEETLIVVKHSQDATIAEFKMNFDPAVFRQMARGRLIFSVQTSKHSVEMKLSGVVTTKLTCNFLQALMTGVEGSVEERDTRMQPLGVAVFQLASDGSIPYVVRMDGVGVGEMKALSLVSPGKKKWKIIQDLIPSYQDGWANGTLARPSAREVELLLGEELHVEATLSIAGRSTELRGQVRQRLYHNAHAVLLPTIVRGIGTSLAGQAWVAVDSSCNLNYEVMLAGNRELSQSASGESTGRRIGRKDSQDVMGSLELVYPVVDDERERKVWMGEFSGDEAEDVVEDVAAETLWKLRSGVVEILVRFNASAASAKGLLGPVNVPAACLPGFSSVFPAVSDEESNTLEVVDKCVLDNGREVEEAMQWKSESDPCQMCSCKRGRIVCDRILCPTAECPDAKIGPGQCCPSCPLANGALSGSSDNDSHRVCFFDGDKKYHAAGSRWHPYIPPFGFSKCAICTCNATTLNVSCDRIKCPTLTCRDKEAYREHPLACCKVCPSLVKIPKPVKNPGEMLDEGRPKDPKEFLAEGGCNVRGVTYPNGHEWHPSIHSFGEVTCVKCLCKDGKWKCKRPKCPNLTCQEKVYSETECCPRCAETSTTPKPSAAATSRKHKTPKGVGTPP